MDNNDKLHNCAENYAGLTDYEYKIHLFNNGKIFETTINFDVSNFLHLAGLEKLYNLPLIERNPNSRVIFELIIDNELSYEYVRSSSIWNKPQNDPQKNNVTYTLEDRIESLAKFRDLLNNNLVKAYSWDSNCHSSQRPYSSEIKANFMLVFEPENKKTPDERIYAFFKLDKNNPEVAHGVSQFPTDRTYNNDGKRSVHEITIMSLTEHDKVNDTYKVIYELPAEEQQKLSEKSLKSSEYATIKADLKQLKSKRTKYLETNTETAQKAYEKKLSIFSKTNIYNSEMLRDVADRLTSQAHDPNNLQAKDLILKEIDLINEELASRKNKNTELSSGITIMQSVRNDNGTITMTKPIVTIETPQAVIKAKSQIEKGTHLADSSIRNFFTNIKDLFKNLFKKQDKPVAAVTEIEPEKKADVSEIKDSIEKTAVSKEMSALVEAREAFAAENISQGEYQKVLKNLMYSLHGKEMWMEAAETLHKQLDECPYNMKRLIGFELKNLEINIEKKFAPKRQQTLDEIKRAAHEQYIKQQSENKSAEKEITTEKNKPER